MSPELRARVLTQVRQTPSPTRSAHQTRVAGIIGIGTFATAALFVAMGGFSRGSRPAELVMFTAGFALVVSVVLTRITASTPRSMLPRSRALVLTACALAAPVLALAALAAGLLWPGVAGEEVAAGIDLACGGMALVQGTLPLLVLLLPRRGGDPVHPVLTGAALGMTAGAFAATMAYLRCPHTAASHGIVAHVAPAIVLTVAGALLGRLLLGIRGR